MTAESTIRLTQLAKRAGCAAKHPPGFLLPLLGLLPPINDPRVLVGSSTADDAAVIQWSDDTALVFTTDFFTPIVDAPRDFGRVAAANALSDVYAMGGIPLAALSIVGFPDSLDATILGEILSGAHEIVQQAGANIVGGHTIKSEEPIFGLAVVGTVHPQRVFTNAGAKPGDSLILTKPLGLGIISTAAKNGQDSECAIGEAIEVMTTLNREASQIFQQHKIHALTDVTGFGLLGHLRNITSASGVEAEIWAAQVPILQAARNYVTQGIAPGGTRANLKFLDEWVTYEPEVDIATRLLLCDAQTSGGLLASIPAASANEVLQALQEADIPAAIIGRITVAGKGRMDVRSRNPNLEIENKKI